MRVKYMKDRTEWWLGLCIRVDRKKQGDLLVLLRKSQTELADGGSDKFSVEIWCSFLEVFKTWCHALKLRVVQPSKKWGVGKGGTHSSVIKTKIIYIF